MRYDIEHPWHRQPCDTPISWSLFSDYRDAGPGRSLAVLARGSNLSWQQIHRTAREDAWTARANAYDEWLEGEREETIMEAVRENAEATAARHIHACKRLVKLGSQELEKYLRASSEGEMPGLLVPRDVLRFITLGIRAERLIRGDATDRVEQGPDLSRLSTDDLRTLREIQARVDTTGA